MNAKNLSDKQNIDQLISARWVIPITPANTVLEHHSVAINQGEIVALLPTSEAIEQFATSEHIELEDHVLIPGLINAHGHCAMSLFRGYADDLPLMEWLEGFIWPAEGKWVSESFVADGTQLAIAEMLLCGTTCYSDMYFFPEAAARVSEDSGVRSQFSTPVFEFPSAWGLNADDYLDKALALHDTYRDSELTNIALGPHAPYTVENSSFEKIVTAANDNDLCIQTHLHETAHEIAESLKLHGKRPIERLHNLGVLSEKAQCVHMTQIDDDDIRILQETQAHIVHCPKSNLKLASGFCPTAELIANDINVCIGTDGASSNNTLDMFNELNIAALLGKGITNDAAALDAHCVLRMATLNGAKALNLHHDIGSIEVGKKADLIAVDIDHMESQPLYDPASHLVYLGNGTRVSHAWVNGKLLLKNRQMLTLDYSEILTKAKQWGEKIKLN